MPAYNIVNPGSMAAGQPEDVSQVLANFQAIAALLNGGLDGYNISSAAALSIGSLVVAGSVQSGGIVQSGTFVRAHAGNAETVLIGSQDGGVTVKAGFTFGVDTNLYRSAAGLLRTDGTLMAGSSIIATQGGANQITVSQDGRIYFGSANDTSLYRSAAATLSTDGTLGAAQLNVRPGTVGQVRVGSSTSDARIDFGTAFDVSLYRSAAGVLRTDGVFGGDLLFNVAVVTTARTGGAAAALPANPVSYIPVLDISGNRRYIPCYS